MVTLGQHSSQLAQSRKSAFDPLQDPQQDGAKKAFFTVLKG